MRKIIFALTIALMGLLTACQDSDSALGAGLVDSSFKNVVTDDILIKFSTILVDSIATGGDSITQVGMIDDAIFGKVKSTYYCEYTLSKMSPDGYSTYRLDSITLTFVPTGDYWGDTLQTQYINVYEITKEFFLEDDEAYYNVNSMPYADEPLCTFEYKPRPGKLKTEEFRLPDSWGQKLLTDMVNEEDYFDSQEKFKTYFPGLAITGSDDGTCISGFKVKEGEGMHITMYYHRIDDKPEEKTLTISVNTSYAFTGIEYDRTGATVEALNEGGALNAKSSTELNYKGYLCGLAGIYNAIEFPDLNDLLLNGDVVSIESATLYLFPEQGTYGTFNQLPSTLRLYTADENNITQDQVYDSMGSSVQDGNLTIDSEYGITTYYSFDLTSFIQDNIGTWGINRQKLFLILDDNDFVCTFGQAVFSNDPTKDTNQMKLSVYYKAYNR